jgi:hypothetical protein
MKKLTIVLASFFSVFYCHSAFGQTSADSSIDDQMTFELRHDTLVSNTGLKLFVGQKLMIGNAAGQAGQYRSIISRKAALVPSIWGQDPRYDYAIEHYVASRKDKEKVKKSLIPGNLLAIKAIGLSTTAKPHFYMVALASDSDVYKCDIRLALLVKELLLEQ